MSIRYESLDEKVRECMINELDRDKSSGSLYISKRLSDVGAQEWASLLHDAIHVHDDEWLAMQIRSRNLMLSVEQRRKPKGGFTTVNVPHTAPDTLAEGEFNRFYIRGVCVMVLSSGGTEVEVYRGKEVDNPRIESQEMIGKRRSAQKLLDDLRANPGVDTGLGLPPGPNSGLTVRRVL